MKRAGEYALIHVFDPARAAQYAALVEENDLAATPARSEEEARFHAQRLGPAALIIAEVRRTPDGFDLLKRLRRGRRPQNGPTVLLSGSLKVRDEAIRLREELDIVEILAGSQPLSTVQQVLTRAIRRLPSGAWRTQFPEVSLLGANSPVPAAQPAGAWHDSIEAAARALGAPMAVAWFTPKFGDELVGWFGWDRSVVSMVGVREEWEPFRNLASVTSLTVEDADDNELLRRSPLVRNGIVRSFAGAPLLSDAGESIGAFWIAHEQPGAFSRDSLQALATWAQRIGADRGASARSEWVGKLQTPVLVEPARISQIPGAEAMAQLLRHAAEGFIATDAEGLIAFANPAASRLLAQRNRRLNGLRRTQLIDLVRRSAGLEPETAARILNERSGEIIVELHRPHRILRWEVKPLPLGTAVGRMDQLTDVTAAMEEREVHARMARLDPLTWLANRRGFDEALAREVSRAVRFRTPLSLAFFRIDPRAERTAAASEQALRDVAWMFAESIRGYDQGARLEDGMLAFLLPGTTYGDALKLAERLARDSTEIRIKNAGQVTLSGGIAQFDPQEDAAQMVARARAALLEAAACGGNGVL